MKRYFLFLRGINVGGKNKVSMPLLKETLENNRFKNVITYINSGNIIFTSDINDVIKLQKICKQVIKDTFNLDISLVVILVEDLKNAIKHAPIWWDNDSKSKHNAIIVIPPMDSEDIIKEVGAIKPEYEKIESYQQVIFWSAPIETFSRTRYAKIVSTTAYAHITIRNANTIKKVLELANY